MREYKFRGKTESGRWAFGSLLYSFENAHIVESDYFKPSNDAHPELTDVICETVGQYTGMKDKNGVEIYEGDKLQFPQWKEYIMTVIFRDGGFGWNGMLASEYVDDFVYMGKKKDFLKEIEVIGNIHEEAK